MILEGFHSHGYDLVRLENLTSDIGHEKNEGKMQSYCILKLLLIFIFLLVSFKSIIGLYIRWRFLVDMKTICSTIIIHCNVLHEGCNS